MQSHDGGASQEYVFENATENGSDEELEIINYHDNSLITDGKSEISNSPSMDSNKRFLRMQNDMIRKCENVNRYEIYFIIHEKCSKCLNCYSKYLKFVSIIYKKKKLINILCLILAKNFSKS